MPQRIVVNAAKLGQAATNFTTAATDIKTLTGQMTETVKSLSGNTWTGDAATQYVNKFEGLQGDIERLIRMVNETSNDLNQMKQNYENAESENVQVVSALKSNAIS